MDNNFFMLNNKIYSNNNDILFDIVYKLDNIVNDLNNKKHIDIVIKQIRNIIIIVNNIINETQKNKEEIKEDIRNMHNK